MQNLEIIRMQLIGFGKFRDRIIELSPGLNLLEGPNEAGKSTIQAFLTGMFYGFFQPGAKRRSYTLHRDKYQPWDGGSYRGVLVCRNEERTWRIERTFDKDSESVKVYDDLTGDDLTLDFAYNTVTRQAQVGEKLLGLSKTAFNNTANIAQMTCASVAQESGFSAEVSDKLLSMMKTADSSLSLSAVIHQLDSKAEQIGSPKKSKTPYGIESLREKELVEELEEAEKNEAEYQNLCEQGKSLSGEIQQLEKEKSLLEAQIRESAAKELGGRYLKAQNLRVRIERIEKEQEKYRIYQDVDPEIIDQAQKRLGAKAQITRTLEKYRRALEELNHRIQELNNLYRTLEVSGADEETLSQFDLMFERHKNLEQLRDELYQLQIKKTNVAFHRSKLSQMDGQKLEEDMQEYRRLEQMKQEKQPEKSNTAGIFVLVFGLVFVLSGVAAALFGGEMVPAAAAYGAILIGIVASATGLILLLTLRKASGKGRKGESLERICQMQQDILEDYQLSHEVDPLACLEEMLGKVQVNNYKIKQFEEQENLLLEEILSKNQRVNQLDAEISAYLGRLTAKAAPLNEEGNIQESSETESVLEEQEMVWEEDSQPEKNVQSADEVRLKSLRESVNQAKRIRTDLQRLHLQQQQIMQEEENCKNQIEQINTSIQQAVDSCRAAGAQSADDLEKCRQGKRRLDEVSVELKLQKELLTETLGGYSFEELEQNVRSQKAGESDISPDRRETREKLAALNEKLSELGKQAAELEGVRRGREESQRPTGQVQAELDEVRSRCKKYQLELDAIALAKEKLLSLSGQLHRDFAPQLNARVSKAIERITNSRYSRAVIDQTLGVRLEDKKSGKLVDVSSLSSGSADLIYLVMRLELLDLLCGENRVPVIFDDSFTQLDDERTARLLSYLLEDKQRQILLFSCHSREREMLSLAQIPCHVISLNEQ